jgi:hypothetical protein
MMLSEEAGQVPVALHAIEGESVRARLGERKKGEGKRRRDVGEKSRDGGGAPGKISWPTGEALGVEDGVGRVSCF